MGRRTSFGATPSPRGVGSASSSRNPSFNHSTNDSARVIVRQDSKGGVQVSGEVEEDEEVDPESWCTLSYSRYLALNLNALISCCQARGFREGSRSPLLE